MDFQAFQDLIGKIAIASEAVGVPVQLWMVVLWFSGRRDIRRSPWVFLIPAALLVLSLTYACDSALIFYKRFLY
jgi:hypothetical protein